MRPRSPLRPTHVSQIDLSDSELTIHLLTPGSPALVARLGKVRRGNDVRIVLRSADSPCKTTRNEELVHMLADARAAQQLVLSKPDRSLASLAKTTGRSEKIFKRMLRLSYLAPEIAAAILEGNQPSSMTCRGMHRVNSIPLSWTEQRAFFQLD